MVIKINLSIKILNFHWDIEGEKLEIMLINQVNLNSQNGLIMEKLKNLLLLKNCQLDFHMED